MPGDQVIGDSLPTGLRELRDLLAARGIASLAMVDDRLAVAVHGLRFVDFEWHSLEVRAALDGGLYFLLTMSYRLWGDDQALSTDQIEQRIAGFEQDRLPDIHGLFQDVVEKFRLSLDVEYQAEGAEIDITGSFGRDAAGELAALIVELMSAPPSSHS